MKSDAERRIIGKFVKGRFSRVTATVFGGWLARKATSSDDPDFLRDVWDQCDGIPLEKGLTENPLELIAESGRQAGAKTPRGIRRILVTVSMAASICVCVLCGYLAGKHSGPDLCLASASHSKGYFVLSDSSKVWLNNGSKLYLSEKFSGKSREVRLEGEGYFEVARNEKRPFIVHTKKMDVSVLGTKFTVSSYDGKPNSVCLSEGSVKVSGTGVPTTVLRPGQLLSETGSSWTLRTVRTSIYTDWTGDLVKFDEVPLTDIAASLEHWYNVRISLSDECRMSDIVLSLSVRYEPIEEILEAVEVISGVHYRMLDSGIIELFLE